MGWGNTHLDPSLFVLNHRFIAMEPVLLRSSADIEKKGHGRLCAIARDSGTHLLRDGWRVLPQRIKSAQTLAGHLEGLMRHVMPQGSIGRKLAAQRFAAFNRLSQEASYALGQGIGSLCRSGWPD
jgi:hypothetical protein